MASPRPDAALVRLRVQPRASRDEIVAWQDDALRVRVTAPPVEGEANAAVRQLLARHLGVAPSAVEVMRGERSRDKLIRVNGLSLAAVRARLARLVAVTAALLLPLIAPSLVAPVAAEHLTLDPGARPPSTRSFDADVNARLHDDGFSIGGRLFGFGQSLGGWLRGRLREGGVTLDGQLLGERSFNFRLDADTGESWPSLRIDISPGTP
jgi:uncharacterized protein (TIGR00251 family)